MQAGIGPAEDFSLSKLGMPGPEIGHPETEQAMKYRQRGHMSPAASSVSRIGGTSLGVAIPAVQESTSMRRDKELKNLSGNGQAGGAKN